MPVYRASIHRCQHIKVNGTQCGSPALRDEKCCYYHVRFRRMNPEVNLSWPAHGTATLPTLEDANSIQVGLAEVVRLLVTQQIDHSTAGLLLYALQTASANLKHTSFEPPPTRVVIDPESVERRPIGATAWSKFEGREYDEAADQDQDRDMDENDDDQEYPDSFLKVLIERRLSLNPEFLDEWVGNHGGEPGQDLAEHGVASSREASSRGEPEKTN